MSKVFKEVELSSYTSSIENTKKKWIFVTIPNIQTSIGKDVGFCTNIRINRKNVKRLF